MVPVGVWIAFFAAALTFVALPGIDLAVARVFFTPGAGFTFDGSPPERLFYHSVEWLTLWGSLALVGLWVYGRAASAAPWPVSGRNLVYLLLILALGPGLIVNTILKENWGRARPAELVEFGGQQTFSPAFVPSDQGGGSFSSGHAAAAFYWAVVAAVLSGRRRPLWLALALGYGTTVGLVRMAAGGHYLSDVVVSFFIVLILALMLRPLLLRGTEPLGSPTAGDAREGGPRATRRLADPEGAPAQR